MPYVADTHSLVWHFMNSTRLSRRAKTIFEEANNARDQTHIPCIVFFELVYLAEKKKPVPTFETVISLVTLSQNYKVEPLCLPIIKRSAEIPRSKIADPWDRLIAATSLHLNLPLITRDKSLRKLGLTTVW